ncbi:hypothetical protein B0T14DRAFT_204811 [Immersiella caudata]|uniref:Uncharacterized protein n=1 Tax=Immersiella caudata TaxID=314043 RepID=A0AA39WPN6_9PEZI|nr:hypothetical protein B0T14DRAFT_204811 [Immersiella caudata]
MPRHSTFSTRSLNAYTIWGEYANSKIILQLHALVPIPISLLYYTRHFGLGYVPPSARPAYPGALGQCPCCPLRPPEQGTNPTVREKKLHRPGDAHNQDRAFLPAGASARGSRAHTDTSQPPAQRTCSVHRPPLLRCPPEHHSPTPFLHRIVALRVPPCPGLPPSRATTITIRTPFPPLLPAKIRASGGGACWSVMLPASSSLLLPFRSFF